MLDTHLTVGQVDLVFEVLTAAGFIFNRDALLNKSVREIVWTLGESRRSRKVVAELIEAVIEPA